MCVCVCVFSKLEHFIIITEIKLIKCPTELKKYDEYIMIM